MNNVVSFWERMYQGMGAAGWCIGFLAVLGLFLILTGIVVLGIIEIAKSIDEREARKDAANAGNADAIEPGRDARTLGRNRTGRTGTDVG